MKAYKHLVKHALKDGFTVSVFDGEIWEVKNSQKYTEIIECIESVEEAQIRIKNLDGDEIAWALIILELDEDESIADYTDNEYMQYWWIAFTKHNYK